MRILIGCEFSGIVRDAFLAKGHDAMSCDLLDTESLGPHYKGDIRDILYEDWDAAIFHPPCTHLAVSGARHFKYKQKEQEEALDFVRLLLSQYPRIPKICIENPVSIISTSIQYPSQVIHPWQFGTPEKKSICLWIKGFPLLRKTNVVKGRSTRIYDMGPSPTRWKERSRFYPTIAEAMANQWS